VRGPIYCSWRQDGERFSMKVTLPDGAPARIHVPAAEGQTVSVATDGPAPEADGLTYHVTGGSFTFVAE